MRFRTVGDLTLTGCGGVRRPTPSTRSSTRSPSPGSPSAARPAATTGSPRPPWRTARRRATSDGSASLRHGGLGRRRQVHPHRAAAAGLQVDLRGPAGGRRGHQSTSRGYDYTDLALLTDGLRSEREQGITIDVAYRYFATPTRKFIIADTPGHVQYTRNMVTGASTADLGLVLVDARQGLTEQSRRHAVLLSLLRVPHLVLAINKMDLVDWSQETLRRRSTTSSRRSPPSCRSPTSTVIPISALKGDNVVDPLGEHARGTTGRR